MHSSRSGSKLPLVSDLTTRLDNGGLPLMLLSIWTTVVLVGSVVAFVSGGLRDSNPLLLFWFVQTGVVSGAAVLTDSVRSRRWASLRLGACAVAMLTFLLFLYFPMGPAECAEWVEADRRLHSRTEPSP